MEKIIIAIDGYSSTGKSTIAKQLAKELSYIYVDTGAMYRAVTLYAMQHDFINDDSLDEIKITNALNNINITFTYNDKLGFSEVFLNGINVEKEIRSLEVSKLVSKIAELSSVRRKLVKEQQAIGINSGLVMDGRDIGTVVFPNAELKLFMTASVEKRAVRRYNELIEKGFDVKYKEIEENVAYRDHIDSTREDSPLRIANDAIEFDNTDLSIEEQFKLIHALVEKKIKE